MTIDISVSVTRYNEPNEIVTKCIESLSKQTNVSAEILFLDQQDSKQVKDLCQSLSNQSIEIKYLRIPAKSLSFARNEGIRLAQARYIAFCDADCILQSNWLAEILSTFKQTNAAIVGTKIIPRWLAPTSWYHNSKYIQEFYSLLNVSPKIIPFKKIIGASFAFDREQVGKESYFVEKFARRGGLLFGGDDTDFSARVLAAGGKIYYTPFTFAEHTVSKERLSFKWIQKRAYFGGVSRALRGGFVDTYNSQVELMDYFALALILPSYVTGYLRGKLIYE